MDKGAEKGAQRDVRHKSLGTVEDKEIEKVKQRERKKRETEKVRKSREVDKAYLFKGNTENA